MDTTNFTEITSLSSSPHTFVRQLTTAQVEVATPLGLHRHLLRITLAEEPMRDHYMRLVEYFTLDRGWLPLIEHPFWKVAQAPRFSRESDVRVKEIDQIVRALISEAVDLLRRAHG